MADERTPSPRPAILAVDDEPGVLAAVARDLRRRFGDRYRILRSSSGAEALDVLRELRTRGEQAALLIADQRMPGMSGTEYLQEARKLVPAAKRVLLTAYADTSAAIEAINEVGLDYYLLKPWDPPEEQLYPVVEDLLTTWEAGAALDAGGVRVIGHRFSKETHDLRDFLARNRVPARWMDVERDGEARELLTLAGVEDGRLPVAFLEDGAVLERPSVLELAERLGVTGQPSEEHYDLVIVGGGPAGLAAAVYGASEGLRTVLVERDAPGGQAGQSSRIENYLGFPAGLSGSDLARRATDQARRLGAELLSVQDATALRAEGAGRAVELSGGCSLSANCVLVASGVSYRQLDAPGFAELTGAGIYYGAALTEARSCADQQVVIVGGANSAGQAAVYFSGYAAAGDDARARAEPRALDVAVPDRADRRPGQRRGAHGRPGRRGARARRAPRGADRPRGRGREPPGRRRLLRLHRRPAPDRLARGRRAARRARVHPRRPGHRPRGLAAGPRPVSAGDERPGRVRGRRRPRALDQARGERRRRGLDVGLARPRLPGRRMSGLTLADLRPVDLFDDLSDEELAPWVEAAVPDEVPEGTILAEQDQTVEGLTLLLEGTARSMLRSGDDFEPVGRQEAPTWMGAIASLTEEPFGVHVEAQTPCRIARIPGERFRELIFAQRPVHRRVMRQVNPVVSRLTGIEANRERLASLGTMAAGLAHEMNNPAAAARRAATELAEALDVVNSTLGQFVAAGIEREQAAKLLELHAEALNRAAGQTTLSTLDAADREDELTDELERIGVAEAWRQSEPLAKAGIDVDWIERVGAEAGPAVGAAIRWTSSTLAARELADDLLEATKRMSDLVGAVKTYAYMDRGGVVEVDLHEGIETTITVLGHKLKKTEIEIVRDYDKSLPRLMVYGSELNQVWTNLLDNAIDALGERGTITIRTLVDGDCAHVQISDDGPGVPADLQDRVFDSFVTTKEVGRGTGLGLATAWRVVVERHHGSLTLDSEPGHTTFDVWIPFAQSNGK